METSKNVTICDVIADYMTEKSDAVATLKELYRVVKEKFIDLKKEKVPAEETIRAAIYRSPKKYDFKRIGKGLYFLKGSKTSSLLIQGDGRNLEEIDDESIDCIITDHPWEDSKAHKSGNQKGFAEYETFEYKEEDFKAKSRVLKEGCYLVEFLPIESATNWKYLSKIKELAEKSGFKYYCQLLWRNAPEGTINTGRTTKGVQQILLFSKGKPRRLSQKGKPYLTKNMLSYEIDIPANKGKLKVHQAEKPLPLYEYLIENLTEEEDVCLDQFGGSCNLLQASVNKNRWGIVYEKFLNFAEKATERFNMIKLFSPSENEDLSSDSPNEKEIISIKIIPAESTKFQYNHLKKCLISRKDLLDEKEISFINSLTDKNCYSFANKIDELFSNINEKGYKNYKNNINLTLSDYEFLNPIYKKISEDFNEIFNNSHLRSYYLNYKLEMEMFVEYAVVFLKKRNYEDIITENNFDLYIQYQKNNGLNWIRTEKVIGKYMKSKKSA